MSNTTNFPQSASLSDMTNPFVGLRPFKEEEGVLFFGRRQQTLELMKLLHENRFLGVIGTSGCGKSSLIYAGLIPRLRAGFPVGERDRWRISVTKPGHAPMRYLAQAVLSVTQEQPGKEVPTPEEIINFAKTIRLKGSEAIINHLLPVIEEANANLLLLVDQFEELFAFGLDTDDPEHRDEAADFISIILDLTRQRLLPIYVVMTMRSDFLGECQNFYGLPEAMNQGQYLVPRLTRQQLQEAISSPIKLFWRNISPRLLDRVLNDIGEQSDQLPVLQHAMMRTWDYWVEENNHRPSGTAPLDLSHYEMAGTIKHALSIDANKALEETDPEICKLVFQALTTTDTNNRRKRNPTHLKDLEKIIGADTDKILEVINRFSESSGRSFLIIEEDQVTNNPRINISHESLIRQWDQMEEWLTDEDLSRDIYTRLADAAQRYVNDPQPGRLWRDPELQLAQNWYDKKQPSQEWAGRYHSGLTISKQFLSESLKERQVQKEREEAARQMELASALERYEMRRRQLRNFRFFSGILGLLLLTALSLAVYAMRLRSLAEEVADQAKNNEKEAQVYAAKAQRSEAKARENLLNAQAEKQRADAKAAEAEARKKEAIAIADNLKQQNRINERQFAQLLALRAEAEWGEDPQVIERSALLAARSLNARDADDTPLPTLEGYRAGHKVMNSIPRIIHTTHIEKYVGVASFSRNGKRLATVASNYAVQIMEAETGRLLSELKDFYMWPHWGSDKISMSDDGQHLVTLSRNYKKIFATPNETGANKIPLEIQMWNTSTGNRVGAPIELIIDKSTNVRMILGPDATRLLTLNQTQAKLWALPSGTMIAELHPILDKEEKGSPPSISFSWAAFSPDRKTFATVYNDRELGGIYFWNATTGESTSRMIPSQSKKENLVRTFEEIIYSPDGKLLITKSGEKTYANERSTARVLVWDVPTLFLLQSKEIGSSDFSSKLTFSTVGEEFFLSNDFRSKLTFSTVGEEFFLSNGSGLFTRFRLRENPLSDNLELQQDPDPLYFGNFIDAIGMTEDGKRLITIRSNGELTVRDTRLGITLGEISLREIYATSFQQDGRLLALANKNELHMLDSKTWKSSSLKLTPTDKNIPPAAAAFSEGGNFLATLQGRIRVWDMARRESTTLEQKDQVKRTVFASGGRYILVIGEDHSARIIPSDNDSALSSGSSLFMMPKMVGSIAFTVNEDLSGYLAIEVRPGKVRIDKFSIKNLSWEVTGTVEIDASKRELAAMTFSGPSLVTADNRLLRIWTPGNGNPAGSPIQLMSPIHSLIDSSTSMLGVACQDGTVSLLKIEEGSRLVAVATYHLSAPPEKLALSLDNKYLVTLNGGQVTYFEIGSSNQEGHVANIAGVADFSITNSWRGTKTLLIYFADANGTAKMLDVKTQKIVMIPEPLVPDTSSSLSPVNVIAVAGTVGMPLVWNAHYGNWVTSASISVSPNGKYIALHARGRLVRIIPVDNPINTQDFAPGERELVTSAEFDSAGRLITISRKRAGEEKNTPNAPNAPNNPRASQQNSEVIIWEVQNGPRQIAKPIKSEDIIEAVAIDSATGLIATSSVRDSVTGGTISFWKNGEEISNDPKKKKQVIKHKREISRIAFSPDGRFLVGTGPSGAHIWDIYNKEEVATPTTDSVRYPAFSYEAEGRFLSVASDNTVSVQLWRPEDLAKDICSRLNRNLTQEEWQEFMGENRGYKFVCQGNPHSRGQAITEAVKLAEEGRREEAEQIFKEVMPTLSPGTPEGQLKNIISAELNWHESIAKEMKHLVGINKQLSWSRLYNREPVPAEEAIIKRKIQEAIRIFDQFWEQYQRPHSFPLQAMGERLSDGETLASTINNLCWNGALYGQAERVRSACEFLGDIYPAPAGWREIDSRGVVRALNGNPLGAIEDFRTFIKHAYDKKQIEQRERWIKVLENCVQAPKASSCKNPITKEEIEVLRKE